MHVPHMIQSNVSRKSRLPSLLSCDILRCHGIHRRTKPILSEGVAHNVCVLCQLRCGMMTVDLQRDLFAGRGHGQYTPSPCSREYDLWIMYFQNPSTTVLRRFKHLHMGRLIAIGASRLDTQSLHSLAQYCPLSIRSPTMDGEILSYLILCCIDYCIRLYSAPLILCLI